jgi:hypothetical protein
MNQNLKAILLTVLTLSCFVIALVELSGVSKTALFNKYHLGPGDGSGLTTQQADSRENQIAAMPKTALYFYETEHNFGNLKEGDVVKYAYKFKNTGTNPLMIAKVDVTCGCTVPSFSKEPIAPGGEGEIILEYNSAHHPGHQKKNAIVHSNGQVEALSIGFEAEVKEK